MSILENFLKDSNAAHTQEEVYDIFAKALEKLGFDAHSYVLLNQSRNSNEPPHKVALYNISQEVMDVYFAKKLEDINYVHHTTRFLGQPVEWYNPAYVSNKVFKSFLGELYGAGYRSGITTPIYGKGMETAFVNVSNYHAKIDIKSEEIEIVRLMSHILHERIKALETTASQPIALSPREKEVLQWIMAGKSESVISDIMKISDHTVNTYLRRCYSKLGVSNRIAAVVKALSLGLITL